MGRLKTESARERLLALNPELKVELHEEGVTPGNSVELFSRYDLVIDGTDNFGTRYLNNDAAFFAGKPLVYGSIFQFEGQVSLFDPQRGGPCYRCLFPRPPAPGTVPNCAEAGVFGALCGTVGSMQAMEAIKLLLSVGKPLLGRLLVIDALGGAVRSINVKKDPGCPLCSASASIREIAPANYVHSCEAPLADAGNADEASAGDDVPVEIDAPEARRILDTVPGAILLDVREPFEREICGVPGSVAIPLREVERNLKRLTGHQRILVCCHHGIRSMQTTRYLRSQGFAGVSNVAGGIDAWARLVAPGMRRY